MTIDGNTFKKMIIGGANLLEENKALIDSLNVFPVPDGDTGTNMSLTTLAAAREAIKINSASVSEIANAAASGSLRGARGNSGVIMSQLFRGFAKSLEGKETINCADIAGGFTKASDTAFKAVMKPKEGTILTIARVLGETAVMRQADDFQSFAAAVLAAGHETLKKTTNMLPQLKEAGVVDAGGKGLLIFLEGALNAFTADEELELKEFVNVPAVNFAQFNTDTDIKFAYCTEFFINTIKNSNNAKTEREIGCFLTKIGDSVVVVCDDELIKIHVHTNNPGKVLETAIKYGYLSDIKIENMKLQHTSLIEQGSAGLTQAPPKEIGIIAVAVGDGLTKLFKELGADIVIQGGQTSNPSTDDFLNAISCLNADNIIILPNNKNIVLAANQAANLTKDKKIYIVPSRSIPEGFAAMINFVNSVPATEMTENMKEATNSVKTGEVTFAIKNTTLNGIKVKKGDIIGLTGGKLETRTNNPADCALELLEKMKDDNTEIITLYYGGDISDSEANDLTAALQELYPDLVIEMQYGGQPLYYYILSTE